MGLGSRRVLAGVVSMALAGVGSVIGSPGGRATGAGATLTTIAHVRGAAAVTEGPDGSIYVGKDDSTIVRIAPNGTESTIAGVPSQGGFSGDGGPAVEARLSYPDGLAADVAGNLFVADIENGRVRKIDPAGIITTVAGGGSFPSFTFLDQQPIVGDGGPATSASVSYPTSVAVDTAGNLFIADRGHGRIRKVDSAGTITTVAGIGTPLLWGKGAESVDGPGGASVLGYVSDLTTDAAGNVYFSEIGYVRKITPQGVVTGVAGTGGDGSTGDGGPGTLASVNDPRGVAAAPDGTVYISENRALRVRAVGPDGIIRSAAGTGTLGTAGDGGPSLSAQLSSPEDLAVAANGDILMIDGDSIRRLSGTPPVLTGAIHEDVAFTAVTTSSAAVSTFTGRTAGSDFNGGTITLKRYSAGCFWGDRVSFRIYDGFGSSLVGEIEWTTGPPGYANVYITDGGGRYKTMSGSGFLTGAVSGVCGPNGFGGRLQLELLPPQS